jgi:hypothetical protein
MSIREKRGIQWDRVKIKVLRKGSGPLKKCIKNDRYHGNMGEERNLMGHIPNKCANRTTILIFLLL